jgi:hypothetical protein
MKEIFKDSLLMELLRSHFKITHNEERESLSSGDFPANQVVQIRFPDDSLVQFRYAFAVQDCQRRLIAVFTEHCGYHLFPAADAELAILESAGES